MTEFLPETIEIDWPFHQRANKDGKATEQNSKQFCNDNFLHVTGVTDVTGQAHLMICMVWSQAGILPTCWPKTPPAITARQAWLICKNSPQINATLLNLSVFEKHSGPLSAQEGIAARAFALIGMAGELAGEYGVTGWPERAAMDVALSCFKEWRKYRGKGDLESKKLVEALRQYVEVYGDSGFTIIADNARVLSKRPGYWRLSKRGGKQWVFNSAGLQKAMQFADFQSALKLLIEAGILIPGAKDYQTQIKSHGIKDSFYLIQFPEDDDAE